MKPVVVRGGGDLATGVIIRLVRAGYPVIVLECARPTAIRREAAFCEAVYSGSKEVEGITIRRAETASQALREAGTGTPILLIDEKATSLGEIRPDVVVDAIIAKRNLGTDRTMAPLVIALGPGFSAGEDADYVIETMRGHDLGRIIERGPAMPNTGIPGLVGGASRERVIHAPAAGILRNRNQIGDIVEKGEPIACIETEQGETIPVPATLTGVLRGILPDGFNVPVGMKMADIDPRADQVKNCRTVSDKARCIAGSVLELVCGYYNGVVRPERA